MKSKHTPRDNKGFLFEAEDINARCLCRDVRGFPAALEAAEDRTKSKPHALVLVVPNVALEDWLSRWAEDDRRATRKVTITRRTDGQQLRVVATVSSFGYGVEPAIKVERIDREQRAIPSRPAASEEPAPKSAVIEAALSRRGEPVRRRA